MGHGDKPRWDVNGVTMVCYQGRCRRMEYRMVIRDDRHGFVTIGNVMHPLSPEQSVLAYHSAWLAGCFPPDDTAALGD